MSELEILSMERSGSEDAVEYSEPTVDLDLASLLPPTNDEEASREQKNPDQDVPDVISLEVMQGSRGVGLCSIITICLCMTACSFLLLYQFDVNEAQNTSPMVVSPPSSYGLLPPMIPYESEHFCQEPATSDVPLGHRLLQFQIHVVQNLVHASLVGSAAIVAVVRGDFLWMTYVRNVAFFFIPVGLTYVVIDLHSVWMGETALTDHTLRLTLASVTALAGLGGLVSYSRVFFKIRKLLCGRAQRGFQLVPHYQFPPYLAETQTEARLATLIYFCATLVQLLAWGYYATTLIQWFSYQASCAFTEIQSDTMVANQMKSLQQFEMAYSSGSHQALLVSLFFLAATFPRDIASAGGALLTSAWRFVVGMGALIHLSSQPLDDNIPVASCINSAVEVAVMFPILVASFTLVLRILQRQSSERSRRVESGDLGDNLWYKCPSVSQIVASPRYTSEQRLGARLLKHGTVLLLTELSVECIVLLRLNHIGTDMTHEIYKWYVDFNIFLFFVIVTTNS